MEPDDGGVSLLGHIPWIYSGLMSGTSPDFADEAADEAIFTIAMIVDGEQWLSSANFDAIMCNFVFRGGLAKSPRLDVKDEQLTLQIHVPLENLPTGKTGLTWWILQHVLGDLHVVASQFDLPSPPIAFRALTAARVRTRPPSKQDTGHPQYFPPVSADAPGDVGAELDAMDDNEVLLVLRYRDSGESERQAMERRLRQEDALTQLLGPPLASSASGNAYAIAYELPRNEADES